MNLRYCPSMRLSCITDLHAHAMFKVTNTVIAAAGVQPLAPSLRPCKTSFLLHNQRGQAACQERLRSCSGMTPHTMAVLLSVPESNQITAAGHQGHQGTAVLPSGIARLLALPGADLHERCPLTLCSAPQEDAAQGVPRA